MKLHTLLPLTPCHSSRSRSADPRRRSPRWPCHCCGYTHGRRWPLRRQTPAGRRTKTCHRQTNTICGELFLIWAEGLRTEGAVHCSKPFEANLWFGAVYKSECKILAWVCVCVILQYLILILNPRYIWSHLLNSESLSHPAGSTGALVSDLLQSGTVGPLLSGVKLFGQLQVSTILNPAEENSVTASSITACYYDSQLPCKLIRCTFPFCSEQSEFCSVTLKPHHLLLCAY